MIRNTIKSEVSETFQMTVDSMQSALKQPQDEKIQGDVHMHSGHDS